MFQSTPIPSITILREDRQRRVLTDIDDLADSINRLGLINPITIDENNILIAGERRLAACTRLGWTHIPTQLFSDLPLTQRILVELEENIKRKDITWQEHTAAIAKYHEIRKQEEPEWSEEKTGQAIGMTRQNINKHLTVASELSAPSVQQATTFTTAVERAKTVARKRDDLIHTSASCADTHILHGDFLSWSQSPQPKFNFIHCDFPYGINTHKSIGQKSSNQQKYEDTEEVYWKLFNALAGNLDNFCAPDAHIIFWFSPNLYSNTWEMLKLISGFTFEEHPLIWHRPGEGIAPDPYRRPRRVYETAFYGWRGEAKINRVKDNLFSAPTERERHPHEKSEEALTHFFSMFIDSNTRLLDPTCGSGSALRAGLSLGAIVFGIEKSEEFARIATANLASADRGDS
jgi:ParB family transcriptional regulator, chromosome partitioning protein